MPAEEERIGFDLRDKAFLRPLTRIYVNRGELEQARSVLARLSGRETSADLDERAMYAVARAVVARAEGRLADAVAAGEDAIAEGRALPTGGRYVAEGLTETIEAAFDLGDLGAVEERLIEFSRMPATDQTHYSRGHESRLRARLCAARSENEEAEAGFRGATARFRELGVPFWLGIALFEHAEWLEQSGRDGDAVPLLAEAAAIFERLKARPWLERLDRCPDGRGPPPSDRGRTGALARDRSVLADPRARRDRHGDGRRAAAVLRRVEPADARVHQGRRGAGARGRPHVLLRERRPAVAPRARSPDSTRGCTRSSSIPGAEIVVTASGVQALHLAIRCGIDPGDEAVFLTPAWPNGAAIVRSRWRAPVDAGAAARRRPLRGRLRRARSGRHAAHAPARSTPRRRTRSGGTPPVEEQRALLDFCREPRALADRRRGLRAAQLHGDEPGDPTPSILRLATRDDAVIVIGSFSKTYCMTGWRVGWLVCARRSGRGQGS